MAIQINGDGTITGISVGGLPDGIVDTDMIAANAVATAKIADNAVTSAKSTISGGITHAQTWRRGSFTGTADPITGYTKYTSTNHGSLGADMTESSGTFTFPVTGIWYITVRGYLYKDSNVPSCSIRIKTTTNNSSYSTSNNSYYTHCSGTGGTQYSSSDNTMIFDVTDTSQCKVRFEATGSSANWDSSHIEFIRLGDT